CARDSYSVWSGGLDYW
nr:immunoglobulin heavy chain junction region [Macaca mulatta]MPN83929.1 immunoglobulin heavy chain junction region [Macaca mulatta]MPN84072.1 immunoglobulin heavy chain junction region [Macaca mulatta]MPN84209.1 immunoglobulin heavy chain junction region [Macaca mulatta]MPN84273.1 immunoglobulin heavy chain junction region [Macaca mulatta]